MNVVTSKVDAEKATITATLRAETEAFLSNDFEKWASFWVQDDQTKEVMFSQHGGLTLSTGWDAISDVARTAMINGPPCDTVSFSQQDHQIMLDGDTAWVTFVEHATDSKGHKREMFEARLMRRNAGGWKIMFSSFGSMTPEIVADFEMAVDAKGHVSWATDGALLRLKTHPGLTMSNGRLRARRPDWDKGLQEAIKRAAKYHDYFAQRRYLEQTGTPFGAPVVLGEDDNGRVVVCQISVRDGMTFVNIDPDWDISKRLATAAAIFGFSEAQVTLARIILDGKSLTEASELLGVTINTARTHLTRIYAKTGVNSQPALVRILLSVG